VNYIEVNFTGALVMFSVYIIGAVIEDGAEASKWFEEMQMGVGFNPFSNLLSLIVVIIAIAVAGAIIYLFDRLIIQARGPQCLAGKKIGSAAGHHHSALSVSVSVIFDL